MSQHPRISSDGLDGIREWLDAEKDGRKPDLTLLLRGLPGRDIRGARIADRPNDPKDSEGRSLIAFDIRAPKDAGTKTRYMLPAHFAITRVLDTVPGIRLGMHSGRTKDDTGAPRYYVDITIGGRPTNLSRILFDAPTNVDLRERKTKWGDLTEPLTWFNAPVGSIYAVMPNSPMEGGFRELLLRYEEQPHVTMSEPDCTDHTILRAEPAKDGVFRYTTAMPEKMTQQDISVYCDYDWSNEKDALIDEMRRQGFGKSAP